MIGKDIQETYGVRVYKDGKPIIEYPYYSLKKIYEHTIKYENEEDLTKSISESIKKKHSELYEENSKYTAKIVYYPNKEEAKNLINNNPNYVMTNGETSDLMPILYSKDKDIFDENKTKKRYEELVSSERFRKRISNLFWETDGLSKIARAYRHAELEETSNRYGMKLYDSISNGFKWYTAIYVIMSREFPKRVKKEEEIEEIDLSKPLLNFRTWIRSEKSVRDITRATEPTSDDIHWLGEFSMSGDLEKLRELQGETIDNAKRR